MEPTFLGNKNLLDLPKVGFLSSRKIASIAVLRCYDWACEQRDKGVCVMSGFQSPLEKDVFHFLLKGKQPIILVLSRALYKSVPEELKRPLEEGRLLIISPVSQRSLRPSLSNAQIRNQYIIDHSDKIIFGSIDKEGSLYQLYMDITEKETERLD